MQGTTAAIRSIYSLRQLLQTNACSASSELSCNNPALAQTWAVIALVLVLIGGALGVNLPLLSRKVHWFNVDSLPFALGRAFAAGVVLATGFVHMFPEAIAALTSDCIGWGSFPWASCLAVMAALGTNAIEFIAGQFLHARALKAAATALGHNCGHKHNPKDGGCGGSLVQVLNIEIDPECGSTSPSQGLAMQSSFDVDPHSRMERSDASKVLVDRAWAKARKHAVAQILEMGIALHSVLIGIALGVSPSPCTIRPLAGALLFHQGFEGFALGATLVDAEYTTGPYLFMAIFFTLTTPGGIALGLGIRRTYNENSPIALIVSGVFDSISTGILIYMALVNLIAVDFFGDRMRSASKLRQASAYVALFTGAGLMCLIAKWA